MATHAAETGSLRAHSRRQAAGAVVWAQLVLRLASVCRSLRSALLGPQASGLWRAESFASTYVNLAAEPGHRSLSRTASSAQSLQGLCRFLASRNVSARNAVVWGVGWRLSDLLDLEQALHHLPRSLQHLQLLDFDSTEVAMRIEHALSSRAGPSRLTYVGSASFDFPPHVRELLVWQNSEATPREAEVLFHCLSALWQLRHLELDMPSFCLTPYNGMDLAHWHPTLQQLVLCLHVSDSQPHAVAGLTELRPSVQLRLRIVVHRTGRWNFKMLLHELQLRGVQLYELGIRCRSAMMSTFREEQVAHCIIQRRLILHLRDAPNRRLRYLPLGPAVVYGSW